ncbi:MAG: glucodextranase DOMON-like domain-containing protein, partial [Acidimicrobiia bacterium]|nr:glucodextranase DOMON-like domain-containing protein [Acidimicrobiia bacterium]
FDLRRLDVFDLGDQLLFRVTIGDLTNPNETSAADWNATYPTDANCPEGQRTDLNLQNVVILIDSEEGVNTGSIELPDNRWADVAPQDAWEYAIVCDGWWKGLIKSNGTSSAGGWSVLPQDENFFFCASDETNTIDGFVDKSQFTPAELDAILTWDILVMLSGHDGDSNPGNWGGVRWVNDGVSEWNFGGGRNGEDGRERDPNIIDLLIRPGLAPDGSPKPVGRTQEEQLDYLTPTARARFADDRNIPSVEIEATRLVDEVPPTVRVRGVSTDRATVPNAILADSPVVIRADIDDRSGVAAARLFWWAPGENESDRREVPMGRLRGDLDPTSIEWVADLRWDDVAAATDSGPLEDPENLADDVRYISVLIDAVDILGNSTTDQADRDPVVLELPVSPTTEIIYEDLLTDAEE